MIKVLPNTLTDLRGPGNFKTDRKAVISGQFNLGNTANIEDGLEVYESIDGVNFFSQQVLDTAGMLSTLPDTPFIYAVEKSATTTAGASSTAMVGTFSVEPGGRIKGFNQASYNQLSVGDRLEVTGTLTGGIATLDASGIAADANRTASTYTNVAATGALSGTSGTVTVVVAEGGGITSIVVGNAAGSGYVPGESITIADSLLGNGGGAAITFTVATTNAATGIVSGTTYEIKAIDTTNGVDASAQIVLLELDGSAVTTAGNLLTGLSFGLLDSIDMPNPATLTQLNSASIYEGASSLFLFVEE